MYVEGGRQKREGRKQEWRWKEGKEGEQRGWEKGSGGVETGRKREKRRRDRAEGEG